MAKDKIPQESTEARDAGGLLNRIQPIGTDMKYSWEEPPEKQPAQKGWRKCLPVILISGGALAVLLTVILFLVLLGTPPAAEEGFSGPVPDSSSDTASKPEETGLPSPGSSPDKVGTAFFNKLYVFREMQKDGAFRLGVCDTQDRILIEPQYDDICFLNPERLLVTKGEAMGVVDLENRVIYPLADHTIKYGKSANGQSQPLLIVEKEKESILIDLNGGQVGDSWDSLRFDIYGNLQAAKDGETVMLNWQGQPSSTLPSGTKLESARDGESYIFRLNDLYGIADLDRQVLVPAVYDYLTEIIPGRFFVRGTAGEGIIDRQGTEIIPVSQDEIRYRNKEKAAIVRKGSRYRLMDVQTGRLLHPEDWDYIGWDYYVNCWNDQSLYAVKGSREVFLDYQGQELSQKPGDAFSLGGGSLISSRPDLEETVRIVQGRYFFGLRDGGGNQLIPAEYTSLYTTTDDRILAEQDKDGKTLFRAFDSQGNPVGDREYEDVDLEWEAGEIASIRIARYRENGRAGYVLLNWELEPVGGGPYDRIGRNADVFQCWLDGVCRTVTVEALLNE